MTEEVPAPLPLTPPPRVESMKMPKGVIAVLLAAVFFGASATIASVIAANTTINTGVAQQEDVEQNQRILNATCENTRAITEQFSTTSPAPCPTVEE